MGNVGFPGQQVTEVRPFTLLKQKCLELMTKYLRAIKPKSLYGINICRNRAEPRCLYSCVTQGTTQHNPRPEDWAWPEAPSQLGAGLPGTFPQQSHANPTIRHLLLPPVLPGEKTTHCTKIIVPPAWLWPPPQLCQSSSREALLIPGIS